MKKNLRYLAIAAVGAVAALGFSSCAYDPYYSSASVGGTYSSGGYGDGYGYGGRSFSTSFFVGTGDPRWGYDPYNYSYYDYHSRRYYDPYLNGYYPIGYRPPIVYGVPHPYGWRPGGGYIRPPSRITNVTVVNFRNRESAYRNTDYGWARQVRQGPVGAGRVQGHRPERNSYDRKNSQISNQQQNSGYRPSRDDRRTRNQQQTTKPRQENTGRPYRYNTPVTDQRTQNRHGQQRAAQAHEANRQRALQNEHRANRKQKNKDKDDDDDDNRGRAYR